MIADRARIRVLKVYDECDQHNAIRFIGDSFGGDEIRGRDGGAPASPLVCIYSPMRFAVSLSRYLQLLRKALMAAGRYSMTAPYWSHYHAQYTLGQAELLRRPLRGPSVIDIPTSTARNIEHYLEICETLEHRSSDARLFFRGQPAEYTLPDTNAVSLLPGWARARATPLETFRFPSERLVRSFRSYLDQMVDEHLVSGSPGDRDLNALRSAISDGLFRHFRLRNTLLSETSVGRFLLDRERPESFLLEAALQHYGVPTLQLDITYSPLVALYFATHCFHRLPSGLAAEPTLRGGVVYLMDLPERGLRLDGEPMGALSRAGRIAAARPRLANLFEISFDNNSRPRRQFADLLSEVAILYWDGRAFRLPDEVQLNWYAFYIRHRIRLSKSFWRSPSTRHFIHSRIGGWLFPGQSEDLLLATLRSADSEAFPAYELEQHSGRIGARRFEFCKPWRVVLTGPDVNLIMPKLASTWAFRAGWLEELSETRTLTVAATADMPLDVVVACAQDQSEALRIQNTVVERAESSGRQIVVLSAFVLGNSRRTWVIGQGIDTWMGPADPAQFPKHFHDTVFDAMLLLTRTRYARFMKPGPSDWAEFINFVQSQTT